MISKRILPIALAVVLIGFAIIFLAWPILFLSAPPTIHYVGTTADKSELLFEIRNPTAKAWNFSGYGPTLPSCQFRTASRSGWTLCNLSGVSPNFRIGRYLVPAQSTVKFSVPRPSQSKTIEVQMSFFPGSFSTGEQMVEYSGNKMRQLFGRQATNHAVLQQSDVVSFPQ